MKYFLILMLIGVAPGIANAVPGEVKCPPYIGSAETAEYAKARGNYKCFSTARAAKKYGFAKLGTGGDVVDSDVRFADTGIRTTPVFALSRAKIIHFSYNGPKNFIVYLVNASTGKREDLLVNEIGAVAGSVSVGEFRGNFYLEVTAYGPWIFDIK